MYLPEDVCRKEMVTVGRRLYRRGLLTGTDGNISIRLGPNEILITPSGVCKGYLRAGELPKVDMEGNLLCGKEKPARDIRMHLMVYKCRPDVRAIVHAHPPIATGFAIAGVPLDQVTSPEVVFVLRNIGVTEYATPTTEQVPQVVERKLKACPDCDALLLANHGALTVGGNVMDAFYKMETLEMYLQATLIARLLGGEKALNERQVEEARRLASGGCGKAVCNQMQPRTNDEALQLDSPEFKEILTDVIAEVMARLGR